MLFLCKSFFSHSEHFIQFPGCYPTTQPGFDLRDGKPWWYSPRIIAFLFLILQLEERESGESESTKQGSGIECERGAKLIPEEPSEDTRNQHREATCEVKDAIGCPPQIRGCLICDHCGEQPLSHTQVKAPQSHAKQDHGPVIMCC